MVKVLWIWRRAVRGGSRATKSTTSPLTSKLFDESGQSLTPSHAVKGERRYRYYVSRSLIKGDGGFGQGAAGACPHQRSSGPSRRRLAKS